MHGVPRIWEKIAAQAFVAVEGSSLIKKVAYRLAMKMSRCSLEKKWEDRKPSWKGQVLRWVATQIAFRHLLTRLGLSKVRYAFSGGAPLPLATQALWQTWGVDFINMYGASEAGGLITSERPGFDKPGTVGKPTSICRVRLAEDGEVMANGPGVFLGYWNDEKATRETIKEGWLYTGDIAEYTEDGNLRLIDRKKDIMITSGGKNITPSLIESSLKESPYISEAILIAEGKKFPSALIEIDFDTVSEWGRKNKLLYTSYTSLATHSKTYDLIAEEVRKRNEKFARVEQVKKFRIIPKELDPEAGDTTATRKVKRRRMYEMFHDLIEEMYMPEKGERLGSFS
jgi:long-chain acyl-CoA synthetase